jgi:serine/threonine protein kinase/CheY-like chemotaxis protein
MARILVVDDDRSILLIFSKMFDTLGHELIKCRNGADAIEAVTKEEFDIIVLDSVMPEVDGYTACLEIRKLPNGIDVPIIVISMDDSEENIMKFLNAGADDYIIKPIKELAFVAKLNKYLKIHALNINELNIAKHKKIISDRYQIEHIIGYGMHSCVFLAEDKNENTKVVVKVFNGTLTSDILIQKLQEQAEILKQAKLTNIVEVLDSGVCEGAYYIVLSYADGGTLTKLYKAKGNLEELEIAKIGLDIGNAIKSFEESQLLHLDVNPNNIVIDDGKYLLTDFGVDMTGHDFGNNFDFLVWGDSAYVAPEMILTSENRNISSKCDIYSLGITLYEGLTGDNPFVARKPAISHFRQLNLVPPSLCDMGGHFSLELSILIDSMLAKHPSQRPTADEICTTFTYIIDAHNGVNEYELTYAKKVNVSIEETSFFDTPEDADEKTEKAIDTVKEKVNVDLKPPPRKSRIQRYKKKKSLKGINNKLLLILFCIGFFFILMTITQSITKALFYSKPVYDFKAPEMVVTCDACKLTEVRNIVNIEKMRCSVCGGKLHFTRYCKKCHKFFPFRDDIFDFDKYKSEYDYVEVYRCPYCKSMDTVAVYLKQFKMLEKKKQEKAAANSKKIRR